MPSYLSPLHVTAAAERLYRRILRSAPSDLATHAERLGWSMSDADEALSILLERTLVREDSEGNLAADDPRIVIGRLVDTKRAEAIQHQVDLEATRHAIAQFVSDHQHGQGATRRPKWEVVPADLGAGIVQQGVSSTSGPVRSTVVSADWSAEGIEATLELARATISSGRPLRTLYPLSVLDEEGGRAWMKRFEEVGEQQRLTAVNVSEFLVLGDELVLAMADWGDVRSDYVLIRDAMLVVTFRTLFDLAWESALPVPGVEPGLDEDRRLLSLMAAGYKDEAIARYLGVALRTVRRRVASLMDELGVETRFQLGMAAQRRGLLDGGA